MYYFKYSIIIYACLLFTCISKHNEDNSTSNFFKVPELLDNFVLDGMKVPTGTHAEYVNSRIVSISFPEGIYVVTKLSNNEFKLENNKKYQCSCSGSGCNVIAFPNSEGGFDVGCSSCNETCTGRYIPTEPEEEGSLMVGFIDLNQGVDFANTNDAELLSPINANLIYEVPELNRVMDEFLVNNNITYHDDTNNTSFKNIYLNAFGKIISLKVNPKELDGIKEKNNTNVLFGTPTCSCDSGSGGCQLEEIKRKPCGVCPPITVGYQCTAGECVTCGMTLPAESD